MDSSIISQARIAAGGSPGRAVSTRLSNSHNPKSRDSTGGSPDAEREPAIIRALLLAYQVRRIYQTRIASPGTGPAS